MLGKIIKIQDSLVYLKSNLDINNVQSLTNLYVLLQDSMGSYVGEICNIENDIIEINLLGEFKSGQLSYGVIRKPAFNAKVNLIDPQYIGQLVGNSGNHNILLGTSPFYEGVQINADTDKLFGSHLAIFGSTGSGKSCGFARIIQNLMSKTNVSENMNIVIFDAYGEYHNAFNYINETQNYAFKVYTSDNNGTAEKLCIPPWLLDCDDYALLLEVSHKSQITIIEKALRNVSLFNRPEEEVLKFKNNIIASALLDILQSGRPAPQIRDQIFSALSKFYTRDLNLDSIISQPGYNRTLRQCLIIDDNNKINAIEAITSFLQSFLIDSVYTTMPDGTFAYTLSDLANALDFALIDEGVWKSEKIFDDANILKVRLNSLINSNNKDYFEYQNYISKNEFVKRLVTLNNGKKAQIINFNINTLDDRFAKIIVKIYSKLLFNYAKNLDNRASNPFNIFLEEAHRYVQKDTDIEIIGYNIFERIAKEGRKYGVLLGLISQRPCELSSTCLSQCNNFILYKMTHPSDIEYISKVIPNITHEIIERMKSLQPGYCIAFGSAFKLPILVNIEMPKPAPNSSNCQISNIWFK